MFDMWEHLSADLHELFGIDTGDPNMWVARSWPWLMAHVEAVMNTPPNRAVVPTDKGSEVRAVWRTRTQHAYHEQGA